MSRKILVCMLAPIAHYRNPIYSENEVFCGPDCETTWRGSRLVSLKIAPGKVSVKDILSIFRKLPEDQYPELIVVKNDSTRRIEIIDLATCGIPTVFIAGNSQHGEKPIEYLIRYAHTQQFQWIISDHKRHHLHWFAKAGIPEEKLFTIPALNINPIKGKWRDSRSGILFFGGLDRALHPVRFALLARLKNEIPSVVIKQGSQMAGPDLYTSNLININISLNGDLNLRVFEIIAAGGFLLTDRLSAETGLFDCFEEGKEFEAFGNYEELLVKVRYYESHPEQAIAIAKAGYERFWREHTPQRKTEQLMAIISGTPEDSTCMTGDTRCMKLDSEELQRRLFMYETVQEIHRQMESPKIWINPVCGMGIVDDLSDLPRLRLCELKDADIVICDGESVRNGTLCVPRLIAEHILITDTEFDATELSANGYARVNDHYYSRYPEYRAERLISSGNIMEGFGILKELMASGRTSARLLYNLALLSIGNGDSVGAEALIAESLQLEPTYLPTLFLWAEELVRKGNVRDSIYVLQRICALSNPDSPILQLLGDQLALESFYDDALSAYRRALNIAPNQPELVSKIEMFEQAGRPESKRPRIESKKILLVTNLYPPQELGGYGRLMYDFMQILKTRGHTIEVITSDSPYLGTVTNPEPDVYRELELFGAWRDGGSESFPDEQVIPMAKESRERVVSHLKRFQPDLVMLGNLDFIGPYVVSAVAQLNIPAIHHLGNDNPGYAPNLVQHPVLYRAATCSGWLRDKMWRDGYSLNKIDVVYPGARVNLYYREQLPELTTLNIIFAGIVQPYKGAHLAVEAAIMLNKKGIPVDLTLAGTITDKEYAEKQIAKIREAGLEDRIRFIGYVERDRLRELMWLCTVYVHPSVFEEPFGISQVEAMASGLISVCSATGGTREVNEHESSGLHFRSEDSRSLADQLERLHNDHDLWDRLRRNGQKRAMELFDIERSVDRLEEIYAELIADRDALG